MCIRDRVYAAPGAEGAAVLIDDLDRDAVAAATLADCPAPVSYTHLAADIGDRREAIYRGLRGLKPGDALLVAGKGHEQGQTVGDKVLPFDDATAVREAIQRLSEGSAT